MSTVPITTKTYQQVQQNANILKIINNPFIDLTTNELNVKVQLLYLPPGANPLNPLSYIVVANKTLLVPCSLTPNQINGSTGDGSNTPIFSLTNLQSTVENILNVIPAVVPTL